MRRIILPMMLITFLISFSTNINAQKGTKEAKKNLKAYDKVQIDKNLNRYVIYVDQKKDESQFLVELIVGKNMEVDCNNHRLMGELEQKTVEGWGYNYYTFETQGHIMSTAMACPDASKTDKFISADGLKVRYNSRLPIVVYLPKDYDLKYKIWSASDINNASRK